MYDNGMIGENGEPVQQATPDIDIGDIFSHFFGGGNQSFHFGRQPQQTQPQPKKQQYSPPQDISISVTIDIFEAYTGIPKKVSTY